MTAEIQEDKLISLDDLLVPIAVEQFTSDFWSKKPLLIKGDPGKFDRLFSMARLGECLSQVSPGPGEPAKMTASFDHGRHHIQMRAKDAMFAYDAGLPSVSAILARSTKGYL
jgi:hypothetical protein